MCMWGYMNCRATSAANSLYIQDEKDIFNFDQATVINPETGAGTGVERHGIAN